MISSSSRKRFCVGRRPKQGEFSKAGKVYLNGMDVLNGTDNYIFISFNPSSKLYKDYKLFFLNGGHNGRIFTCRVLKTEFKKEEL